jgi:hypothetical protein
VVGGIGSPEALDVRGERVKGGEVLVVVAGDGARNIS